MRPDFETLREQGADALVHNLRLPRGRAKVGLILGTGWGYSLDLQRSVPLSELPGFEKLSELGTVAHHKRSIGVAGIDGGPVLTLSGRVHMFEDWWERDVPKMVRLQIEVMIAHGVKTIILTNAAGALHERDRVGDLFAIRNFILPAAAHLPVWGSEFSTPEAAIAPELIEIACRKDIATAAVVACNSRESLLHRLDRLANSSGDSFSRHLSVAPGTYAYWPGGHFEGIAHDKPRLKRAGGDIVGMSTAPECATPLIKQVGVKVLALSCVTNSPTEPMDHEEHVRRMIERAPVLGSYLNTLIPALP